MLSYYLNNTVTQFTNKKQAHHQQLQHFIQLGKSLSRSRAACPPTHNANRCRHSFP